MSYSDPNANSDTQRLPIWEVTLGQPEQTPVEAEYARPTMQPLTISQLPPEENAPGIGYLFRSRKQRRTEQTQPSQLNLSNYDLLQDQLASPEEPETKDVNMKPAIAVAAGVMMVAGGASGYIGYESAANMIERGSVNLPEGIVYGGMASFLALRVRVGINRYKQRDDSSDAELFKPKRDA